MRFLLWNVAGKDLSNVISAAVEEHDIDVVILVEPGATSSLILDGLNKIEPAYFDWNGRSQCKIVKLYGRYDALYANPVFESSRISVRRLNLPLCTEVLLCCVHLGDKRNNSPESQNEICTKLALDIARVEEEQGLNNTVLLGDLNMNPFEIGMIKANGLHATMSRVLAKKESRIVSGDAYRYFYNPMWSTFNDAKSASAGTYYYRRAELVNYHWNVFDQVLLRPSLINRFELQSLSVLDRIGSTSLVKKASGIPNSKLYSDHLPLIFELDLHL